MRPPAVPLVRLAARESALLPARPLACPASWQPAAAAEPARQPLMRLPAALLAQHVAARARLLPAPLPGPLAGPECAEPLPLMAAPAEALVRRAARARALLLARRPA